MLHRRFDSDYILGDLSMGIHRVFFNNKFMILFVNYVNELCLGPFRTAILTTGLSNPTLPW